jgi:hypothetical protein
VRSADDTSGRDRKNQQVPLPKSEITARFGDANASDLAVITPNYYVSASDPPLISTPAILNAPIKPPHRAQAERSGVRTLPAGDSILTRADLVNRWTPIQSAA